MPGGDDVTLVFGAADKADLKRDPANALASKWATLVVDSGGPPEVFAVGAVDYEIGGGKATVFIYVAPLVNYSPAAEWQDWRSTWRAPTAVRGRRAREVIDLACARLESYIRAAPPTSSRLQLGRGNDISVARTLADATEHAPFEDALRGANEGAAALQSAFAAASIDETLSDHEREFMGRCSDRVIPVPVGDIPNSLKGEVLKWDASDLDVMPFAHESQVPETASCTPKQGIPVAWPTGFMIPTCHADVLEDWCFDEAFKLLELFDKWHADRISGGNSRRPKGKVWGLNGFKFEYHALLLAGATIDFREEGPAVLVAPDSTGFTTHTRGGTAWAADAFGDSSDKQSVDFLRTGVHTKIKRKPCLALAPNLLSMYETAGSCIAAARELDAFRKEGWSAAGRARSRARGLLGTPVLPYAASPHGCVAKKGVDEPRLINESGWPRYDLAMQRSTEIYLSNNVESGEHVNRDAKPPFGGPESPWAPEIKDTMRSACTNGAILRRPADLGGWQVFLLAFDLRKMFHQFFYVWHDLWMCGGIVPTQSSGGVLSNELVAIINFVMAMGWSRASAVATHAYCLWNQRIAAIMDGRERAQRDSEPKDVRRWLEGRDPLTGDSYGTQAKLYDLLAFTDDGLTQVVGPPARAVRLASVIYEVIGPQGLNILLASHSKWLCSTWSQWIGGRLSPALGLIWLPQAKVLRTDAEARLYLSGKLPESECVKMLGFLGHVADLIMFDRYYMRTAWAGIDEHRASGRQPADPVKLTGRAKAAVCALRRAVMNCPGTSMLRAVRRQPPTRGAVTEWVLRGDACFDVEIDDSGVVRATLDGDPPGMGGNFYGDMWHYAFTEHELQYFTIPLAEFVAFGMQIAIFGHRLDYAECVVGEIDAKASPRAIEVGAKAASLMEGQKELESLPAYIRLTKPRSRLAVRHIWGVLNRTGDKASRHQRAAAERLARLLGHEPRWVTTAEMQEALAFKDRVLARLVAYCGTRGRKRSHPRTMDPATAGGPAIRSRMRHVVRDSYQPEACPSECIPEYESTSRHARSGTTNGKRATSVAQATDSVHSLYAPPPATDHTYVQQHGRRDTWRTLSARTTPSLPEAGHLPQPPARDVRTASERELSRGGQRHVEHLLTVNANSTKPWRLAPDDPTLLRSMFETAAKLAEHAAPTGTLGMEESHMRLYWIPFCHSMRTTIERPDVSQMNWEERQVEMAFWGCAVTYIAARMPNKQGVVGAAKPNSVLAALRNVRREQQRPGKKLVSLVQAIGACDGLVREYVDLNGAEALLPHRKEPLTNEIIRYLVGDCFQGRKLGSGARARTVDWAAAPFCSLRALYATLAQTGMRKAEVALAAGVKFTRYHLSMGHVRWLIGGVLYESPTHQQLTSLVDGDYALLTPPPSKADQFGLHWGASTIYLMYYADRTAHPICAARELANEERRRGIAADKRRDTPLFVDGDQPWRHSALNHIFHLMLVEIVGEERAGRHSIHSFRIYLVRTVHTQVSHAHLAHQCYTIPTPTVSIASVRNLSSQACALLAAGASNSTIQSMLRWKSEDALRIYARINDFKYAEWLDKASIAAVSSIRTTTTEDAVRNAADAMNASMRSPVASAEAGFQAIWTDRAARQADAAIAAAREFTPTHDADEQVANFQSSAAALLSSAERADAEDG